MSEEFTLFGKPVVVNPDLPEPAPFVLEGWNEHAQRKLAELAETKFKKLSQEIDELSAKDFANIVGLAETFSTTQMLQMNETIDDEKTKRFLKLALVFQCLVAMR